MQPRVLSGKEVTAPIYKKLKQQFSALKKPATLAIIVVGDHPASRVYIKIKEQIVAELGIECFVFRFAEDCTEAEILVAIAKLNTNSEIDAIFCQLPLPQQLDKIVIQRAISVQKDVDGFHPLNLGHVALGHHHDAFLACTPQGILALFEFYHIELEGKFIVVIGRSAVVGLPLFHLLEQQNATVVLCHSKTVNLEALIAQADMVCVAVGKKNFMKSSLCKAGAIVIDVGINYDTDALTGKRILTGDVDYDKTTHLAAYSPVPGGVGPLTVAMLMQNIYKSASKRLLN